MANASTFETAVWDALRTRSVRVRTLSRTTAKHARGSVTMPANQYTSTVVLEPVGREQVFEPVGLERVFEPVGLEQVFEPMWDWNGYSNQWKNAFVVRIPHSFVVQI